MIRFAVGEVIYFRNVVFPVPAFPVRKTDLPVDFTYLSAVSKISSFSMFIPFSANLHKKIGNTLTYGTFAISKSLVNLTVQL